MALKGRQLVVLSILVTVLHHLPLAATRTVQGIGSLQKDIGTTRVLDKNDLRNIPIRSKRNSARNGTNDDGACTIKPVDPDILPRIRSLEIRSKLLEYVISFSGYDTNPLLENMGENFQANNWKRPLTKQGKVLLTLPFNYALLSLTMLSFGVEKLEVVLIDSPRGCFGNFSAEQKVDKVVDLVLMDFDYPSKSREESGSACHQRIDNSFGIAKFTYECCEALSGSDHIFCTDEEPGSWITMMSTFIKLLKVVIFLFGPSFLIGWIYSDSTYMVNLKRPILKSLLILKDTWASFKVFSDQGALLEEYPRFAENVEPIEAGKLKCVSFKNLHIRVDHRRLVDQKSVPVGVFRFLFTNLIWCGMRRWEPFNTCCKKNIFGTWGPKFLWFRLWRKKEHIGRCSWERVFNLFGGIMMLFALPLPYYLRLVVYYLLEEPSVDIRKEAVRNLNLEYPLQESLILYLDPAHPFMIAVYVAYFVSFVFCVLLRGYHGQVFDYIGMGAVRDMANVNKLESLRLLLSHFILPLEKFGICGLAFGLLYWPIVLPFCLLVIIVYSIPMVYLISRYFMYTRPRCFRYNPFYAPSKTDQTLSDGATSFESCLLLGNISPWIANATTKQPFCLSVIIGFCCSLLNLSAFFILAEVIGFVIEVFLFTLIGAIVNSSNAATYFMLGFWIFVYSNSCFTNVYNKYMEMNLKIFEHLMQTQEADLEEVTTLRDQIQRKTAFKFYNQDELEELRSKEIEKEKALGPYPGAIVCNLKDNFFSDRLECVDNKLYWRINSLAMFVDNEDVPYIPETLFHEICNLETPGSPGPIHLSMFEAFQQLGYMVVFLVFVLITVMTFGDGLSSGNQMLVALAGGFLPFVVRFVLKPKQAQIDVNSLGFKAKLYQIKLRYSELWPVQDLHFTLEESQSMGMEDVELLPMDSAPSSADASKAAPPTTWFGDKATASTAWFGDKVTTVISGLEGQLEDGKHFYNPVPGRASTLASSRVLRSTSVSFPPGESQSNLITVDPKSKRVQASYQTDSVCEGIEVLEEEITEAGEAEGTKPSLHLRPPNVLETAV